MLLVCYLIYCISIVICMLFSLQYVIDMLFTLQHQYCYWYVIYSKVSVLLLACYLLYSIINVIDSTVSALLFDCYLLQCIIFIVIGKVWVSIRFIPKLYQVSSAQNWFNAQNKNMNLSSEKPKSPFWTQIKVTLHKPLSFIFGKPCISDNLSAGFPQKNLER